MGYVRSHTFCFCIPVRFGVFILSTIFLLGGGTMAGFCWYGAVHKSTWRVDPPGPHPHHPIEHARLTKNHEISIVIVSILYTVLAIVSLFGSVRFLRSISVQALCSYYGQIDRNHH
jgi:hypothetical protein